LPDRIRKALSSERTSRFLAWVAILYGSALTIRGLIGKPILFVGGAVSAQRSLALPRSPVSEPPPRWALASFPTAVVGSPPLALADQSTDTAAASAVGGTAAVAAAMLVAAVGTTRRQVVRRQRSTGGLRSRLARGAAAVRRAAVTSAASSIPGEEQEVSRWQLVGQIASLLDRGDCLRLSVGAVALLSGTALDLTVPSLISSGLFAAVERRPKDELMAVVGKLAAVALLKGGLSGLRGAAFHAARNRFVRRLRDRAFETFVRKDMAFFDEVDAGQLTSRLSADCQTVFTLLDDVLNFLLCSSATVVCGFWALAHLSPFVTFNVSIVLGILACCAEWYGRVNRAAARKTQDKLAQLNRVADEAFGLLPTVRTLDAEARHVELYVAENNKIFDIQMARGAALGIFTASNGFLTTFVRVVALVTGGLLSMGPHARMAGELLTEYILYLDIVVNRAMGLAEDWTTTMEALGSVERVVAFATEPLAAVCGTQRLDQVRGDVSFNKVTFSYPMRPERKVLKEVSIHFRAGETTALVGVSGSGKSSIVNLIQRFYDLEFGSVTLDGVDVLELDASWLRQQFGIVGQAPELFNGTVAENISWGMGPVSIDEVKAAAQAANVEEFILELPEGYNTVIDSAALSGGQRQRLAIARALIRDPPVLILDEPTSALDPNATRIISEALEDARWSPRLGRHRSIIVIAHRLGTVKTADQIVVLESGEVAECGTHDELMALGGAFNRLVVDQRLPTG